MDIIPYRLIRIFSTDSRYAARSLLIFSSYSQDISLRQGHPVNILCVNVLVIFLSSLSLVLYLLLLTLPHTSLLGLFLQSLFNRSRFDRMLAHSNLPLLDLHLLCLSILSLLYLFLLVLSNLNLNSRSALSISFQSPSSLHAERKCAFCSVPDSWLTVRGGSILCSIGDHHMCQSKDEDGRMCDKCF